MGPLGAYAIGRNAPFPPALADKQKELAQPTARVVYAANSATQRLLMDSDKLLAQL